MVALIFIFSGVFLAVFLARGYRVDISSQTVATTGILVATSDPDGAGVWINGTLKTATNNTLNLIPGRYQIKIAKDGYTPWEKTVAIKKEEVFKTNAFLFPSLADLRPLTLTGAFSPTISPDSTKIVYGVASASASVNGDGNGLWIIDMSRAFPATPIFAPTDFRQIYRNLPALFLSNAAFLWSADNKQVVAYFGSVDAPSAAYLLDTDRVNDQPENVTGQLAGLQKDWESLATARSIAQVAKLPLPLAQTLATSAGKLKFSPDENKILYTATASANLLPILTTYLPATNPTAQVRILEPGKTYVYDLKEDRNYPVSPCSWFPSSRHLLCVSQNTISVTEFDGTNASAIFSGVFTPDRVFVWPNWSKIVILTTLGSSGSQENLYTINLR